MRNLSVALAHLLLIGQHSAKTLLAPFDAQESDQVKFLAEWRVDQQCSV